MHNTVSDSISIATHRVRPQALADRRQRTFVRGAALMACIDSMAAVVAILAVLVSVNLSNMSVSVESFLSMRVTVKNVLLLVFLATAWPAVFQIFGLYEHRGLKRFRSEVARLFLATGVGCGLAFVFPLTSVTGMLGFGDMRHFWLASFGLCLFVRAARRGLDRRNGQVRRTLVIGTGNLARRAYLDMRTDSGVSHDVVGFIDDPFDGSARVDFTQKEIIGTLAELEQILMSQVIDEVVIALPIKSCYQQIQYAIRVCERAGVQSKYGADLFESTVAFPRYDDQGDRAFVAMQVAPDDYRLVVKRIIDVVGAAAGLIALAPLFLIIAVAIKLTSRGPIVYSQTRCGLSKRTFRMYKFRSMIEDAEQLQSSLEARNEASGPVFKIGDDPRITRIGRLLRKSSLDELPQLWNVLRGEMSLVGPRPLPRRDVDRITRPSDMRRFSMRPGLTCLWQVQGRCTADFERWVELDLEYIDSWSLALDYWILARTIPAVLSGAGAV
jgi:exopolysaccharide biosynthesis polyprenyl glycosylphosphotransferase